MTIREVLKADWTVSWFEVEVRENNTTKLLCRYLIGRDVKPTKYMKYECETLAGDIYKDGDIRVVIINKIIQFRHMPNKPQGKEMCVGVLEKEIPKELLNLTVEHMSPSSCGNSDGMHGYCFTCYVDLWNGICGEDKQLELDFGGMA